MKIPIVDQHDNLIAVKERKDVVPEDIYRVSALWLRNSKGEVLLARRALTKSHDPGKWGPAVAGTIEDGETYTSNIIKEMFEELGLQNIPISTGPKQLVQGQWNFFDQWFTAVVDLNLNDFKIEKTEVEEIAWFPIEVFRRQLEEKPAMFVPSMKNLPKELYIPAQT